jgi:hypothetical protein
MEPMEPIFDHSQYSANKEKRAHALSKQKERSLFELDYNDKVHPVGQYNNAVNLSNLLIQHILSKPHPESEIRKAAIYNALNHQINSLFPQKISISIPYAGTVKGSQKKGKWITKINLYRYKISDIPENIKKFGYIQSVNKEVCKIST